MQPIYYAAEPSATVKGYIGLVICGESHKVILRTHLSYAAAPFAIQAARILWQARPSKLNAAIPARAA